VLGVWAINTGSSSADPLVADAIAKAGSRRVFEQRTKRLQFPHRRVHRAAAFSAGNPEHAARPARRVNFSQLAFSDINKLKRPAASSVMAARPDSPLVSPPLPITGGLAGTPGGLPLYKNGRLVGESASWATDCKPTDITPVIIANAMPTKMSRSRDRLDRACGRNFRLAHFGGRHPAGIHRKFHQPWRGDSRLQACPEKTFRRSRRRPPQRHSRILP